jgi:ribosomal protein S18 acetylase RimI-like enzyme
MSTEPVGTAIRTYLEMREPGALRSASPPRVDLALVHETDPPPALYRTLYGTIGRDYYWTDRAAWTDREIETHLQRPEIDFWVARSGAELAGYFELRRCDDGSVELAYFGVMPAFHGQGVGGYLLTQATREAWALAPTRVWLHTSSLDHRAALPNYLKRGFEITRTEQYES